MAAAGLGDDLLLANESLDLTRLTPVDRERRGPHHRRRRLRGDDRRRREGARPRGAASTSTSACRAAAASPDDAGRLADLARVAGPRGARRDGLRGPPHARARRHQGRPGRALDGRAARRRAEAVGGDVVSGGGTGTWDINTLGHRAPGRLLLPDGHRVHAARVRLRERALRADHGDLGERPAGACSTPGSRRSAWTTATRRCSTSATAGSCPTSTSPSASPRAPTVAVGDRVRVHPRPRRPHRVPARAPPPRRRRRGDRGVGRRPPRLVTGSARRSGPERRNARARWLMACFSSAVISANVRPSPSTGATIGS